jgi:hypothetical protein
MDEQTKKDIMLSFQDWWRNELAVAHKANTVKLASVKKFTINPFLWSYLAYYMNGKADPETLARVLVYPRVLGTSITTSFGTRFQQFITKYFKETFGSTTPGIDIEFTDKLDGRKKYCQLKSGPNVVNRDTTEAVKRHFQSASRLARTNNLDLKVDDFMFCLLYGEAWEKSSFIKEIEKDYPVAIGQEFWHRFTGDEDFYADLIQAIGKVADEFDMKEVVEDTVMALAEDISKNYPEIKK